MWRLALLGVCVVATCALGACASAGSSGPPDARADGTIGTSDAAIDAPVDAPADAALATCTGPATCQTATLLGSVSGDTNNQKLTASGHQSAWYRVRVTEDNDAIGGLTLRVAAKLTSPASPMFDVLVYVNTGSDVIECATTTGTISTNGNTKQVRVEWGEGTIANGSDDGRNVSIEVRPLATSGCSTAASWQLEIEGNWN